MASSEAMRDYVRTKPTLHWDAQDRRQALVDALYRKSDLRLAYDTSMTRTAAQAFDARSGNCLSLVMLTAAMAREIGLKVRFQSVVGAEQWDRTGGYFIAIGHVNLVLDEPVVQLGTVHWSASPLVVDFLPPQQARLLDTRVIDDRTVVAMYLNNRAVEVLQRGGVDDAYWWARASLGQDPNFVNAYLTLGVVYRAKHRLDLALRTLERVAALAPDNTLVLTNRMLALRELGRTADADALAQRLAALGPHPPFSQFDAGMAELGAGRYASARRLFEREIARDPYRHEFEYAAALACIQLNDAAGARQHLARAAALSPDGAVHDLYTAKLDRLRTRHPQ
jgi:tetratricopeptide (TPR) repeat protein